jgi:hypothetical protein
MILARITTSTDPVTLAQEIAKAPEVLKVDLVKKAVEGVSAGRASITPAELLADVDPLRAQQLLTPLLDQARRTTGFTAEPLAAAVEQAAAGVAELIRAAAADTSTQMPLGAGMADVTALVVRLTGRLADTTLRLAQEMDPLNPIYRP